MKTKAFAWMIAAALLAGGAGLLAGCEAYSSDNREITITPRTVALTNDVNWSVTFTADVGGGGTNMSLKASSSTNGLPVAADNDRLYYPLEWSVSDPNLGVIVSSTGNSAVYRSFANRAGLNIVTCRDQSEREGLASVTLTEPAEEVALTAIPAGE